MNPADPSPLLSHIHLRGMQRITLLAFILVLVRGFLPPNAFSATVLLFDYEYGLIRRGLMGEIATLWWGAHVTRAEVFLLSASMSLFGLFTLYAFVARSSSKSVTGTLLALTLFTSIAFDAIVAATGYLDLVLIGLVCLSMLTDPRQVSGLVARALAVGLGVFFHEIAIGYFSILLAADIWLQRDGRACDIPLSLLPLFSGAAALALLMVAGNLSPEQTAAFLDHIAAKAAFKPDPEATVILERHLSDNFAVMETIRDQAAYRAWLVLDGLPLLALSLWTGWLILCAIGPGQYMSKLLCLGAIAAPMSLNVIAFDVVRFGAISALCGFLLLFALWTRQGPRVRLQAALSLPHVLTVMVLNQVSAVTQLGEGELHLWQLPWVLLKQLTWL